jgi:hypothetical protein
MLALLIDVDEFGFFDTACFQSGGMGRSADRILSL